MKKICFILISSLVAYAYSNSVNQPDVSDFHRHFTGIQRQYIAQTVQEFEHCRLLVIGAGHDSGIWMQINSKGTTHFLEHDPFWIHLCKKAFPGIQIFKVEYDTNLSEWELLLNASFYSNHLPRSKEINLIDNTYDVIILDGPPSHLGMPTCVLPIGRMQAFFLAHILFFNAEHPTYLFVHDTDRFVERRYAEKLFETEYLIGELDNMLCYRKGIN